MPKRHIYLAGPMRGIVDLNWPLFDSMAEALRAKGHDVINPVDLDRENNLTLEAWHAMTPAEQAEMMPHIVRRDLEPFLRGQVDTLALLPGWESSRGATAERAIAHWLGLEVRLTAQLLAEPDVGEQPRINADQREYARP